MSFRALPSVRLSVCLACLAILAGCATTKQVQYFEVVSRNTGPGGGYERNFYRMTVRGSGSLVRKFQFDAAYVASATVDSLNGTVPQVREAYADPCAEAYFRGIKLDYLKALRDDARTIARAQRTGSMTEAREDDYLSIARLGWFASLSDADFQSMGTAGKADPYAFRKLVFYSNAENFNLKEYNSQISSTLDKATLLAKKFREERLAEQAKRQTQKKAAAKWVSGQIPDLNTQESVNALIDILAP